MILAAVLFGIIILFLGLLIVFLNTVFLPSVKKQTGKIESDDPVLSYSERNFIVPEKKEFEITDKKAYVKCSCSKSFAVAPSVFNGKYTCFMVKSMQGSVSDCKFACIGLGDCAKVCPQEAISITNRTAVISSLCCGCGKCVSVCPQKIIELIPKNTEKISCCSNHEADWLTSCTKRGDEEKPEWTAKKDFKIWEICYKLFYKLRKH